MYIALKHIHLTLIALSVVFFILRFFWKMRESHLLSKKWVRISPHIIDTMLLLSGILLIGMTGFIPFTPHMLWMSEKLICILLYIVLGFVALRSHGTLFRVFAFLGALGWVYAAAELAVTKTPWLLG